MTKCHLLLLGAILLLLAACKGGTTGPSLSEYGARSEATQSLLFEQYAADLLKMPLEAALLRQDSLLTDAANDSAKWQQLIRFEEKFILDPNSPYRSEERYLPVVSHILSDPYASEQQRRYAEWILPKLQLNRPGTAAADFAFLTPKGRQSSLYALLDERKPKNTLLFFSNPGCPNCKEITEALSHNLFILSRIEEGSLLVVNIYPDQDVQAWLDYLPNYPKEWVCGHDPEQVLTDGNIYWLRAIPSLYLLDEQKRVIFKDAPLEQILIYCEQR